MCLLYTNILASGWRSKQKRDAEKEIHKRHSKTYHGTRNRHLHNPGSTSNKNFPWCSYSVKKHRKVGICIRFRLKMKKKE